MESVRFAGCGLVIVAACSFDQGRAAIDAEPQPGSDADTPLDAPGDMMMATTDAATDATFSSCTTSGLICAGTPLALMCNGACWAKCTQIGVSVPNQATAAASCANWGGKLAPIRNQGDQDCLQQTLFPQQAHWIGFEQASSAASVTAGWSWSSDGVTSPFVHWDSGQPNDLDASETDHAEQCAFMTTAGGWQDVACGDNGLYRFSCRR